VRRFLASALIVALTLLAAETLMVYIPTHPDTTCGLMATHAQCGEARRNEER
jgi:hypothetical protein